MAKSLQDIEQDFYKRHKQEQQGKQEKQKREMKLSLLSDIVFCSALVSGGFFALILSLGEGGQIIGTIYDILENHRELILGIVFTLIIVSFVLRFCDESGKDKKDESDIKKV